MAKAEIEIATVVLAETTSSLVAGLIAAAETLAIALALTKTVRSVICYRSM